jgi:hypothetical protein
VRSLRHLPEPRPGEQRRHGGASRCYPYCQLETVQERIDGGMPERFAERTDAAVDRIVEVMFSVLVMETAVEAHDYAAEVDKVRYDIQQVMFDDQLADEVHDAKVRELRAERDRLEALAEGLTAELEPGFTDEDGTRTFGLSEIVVRHAWTGRGIAHRLHDELLTGRYESRASLTVDPHNDVAYRAYLRWGWREVAKLRPGWPDAPLFDVLVLPLPLAGH